MMTTAPSTADVPSVPSSVGPAPGDGGTNPPSDFHPTDAMTKEDPSGKKSPPKKSRRELPPQTVAILKGWMLSPEHIKHPYPTDEDKQMLLKKTGINMKQLTNWFTNARKRIWKPMMRREHSRQMEMEKSGQAPPAAFNEPVYPPRPTVSHSLDGGVLSMFPNAPGQSYPASYSMNPGSQSMMMQPTYTPGYDGQFAQELTPQYGSYPAPAYQPRSIRTLSETANAAAAELDQYTESQQRRKRPREEEEQANAKRFHPMESPTSQDVLQRFVMARAQRGDHGPVSDLEKVQLSSDTGLTLDQIEMWLQSYTQQSASTTNTAGVASRPSTTSPNTMQLRSIPSQDNPTFPPPPAPTHPSSKSIPSRNNPMFPTRPSVPSQGNPTFPPPPSGDQMSGAMFQPKNRSARSMSTSAYGQPASAPKDANPKISLPGLANGGAKAPSVGVARDGRSRTLDMGLFSDARRRKMNFQDVLEHAKNPPPSGINFTPIRESPRVDDHASHDR